MADAVKTLRFPNGQVFEVAVADLLAEATDAIVNAANGHLAHGGGVAAAISDAAGPALDRESERIVQKRGPIPTGDAVITTAGELPFKGVIHVVGPRLGEGDEEGKLVRGLKAAFRLAQERGWRSVSFPAVSAGIFAVPVAVCAKAYVRAVREFFAENPRSAVTTLRLVLFQGPMLEAVKRAIEG